MKNLVSQFTFSNIHAENGHERDRVGRTLPSSCIPGDECVPGDAVPGGCSCTTASFTTKLQQQTGVDVASIMAEASEAANRQEWLITVRKKIHKRELLRK
jgi:hypothetical protein